MKKLFFCILMTLGACSAFAGAQCRHLSHVQTQLPYALTVAGFSFFGFLLSGLISNWFIVFPLISLLMAGFLMLVKLHQQKKTV